MGRGKERGRECEPGGMSPSRTDLSLAALGLDQGYLVAGTVVGVRGPPARRGSRLASADGRAAVLQELPRLAAAHPEPDVHSAPRHPLGSSKLKLGMAVRALSGLYVCVCACVRGGWRGLALVGGGGGAQKGYCCPGTQGHDSASKELQIFRPNE